MNEPQIKDGGLSRRTALKLLAANVALVTAACGKPMAEILPYVHMPERLIPGIPLQFASTLPLGGYGRGVVCTSVEGRPIKISGNPLHPASLGSTDVFAEAHVLSLYDPDRSKSCRHGEEIASYVDLETALAAQIAKAKSKAGDGLRLLTGPVSSPTVLRQIGELKNTLPGFVWHVHDPLEDRAARTGSRQAFGREVLALPRVGEASLIVTLDADPLGPGPWQIVNARGFADRRRVRKGAVTMNRLYAFESILTVTGAKADHRYALAPDIISHIAAALAQALGADGPRPDLPPDLETMVATLAKECAAAPGHALILVGPSQPPEVHALAHWINARLRAPIDYAASPYEGAASLEALLDDLEGGRVDSLIVSGANPAYDAPPAWAVQERLKRCPFSLHHGLYRDETAPLCTWHVPESHILESWGDLRACDGTPSLVQPLIEALYDTRSLSWLLAQVAGRGDATDYDLVRATWKGPNGVADFEGWWRKALHNGVISGHTPAAIDPGPARLPPVLPQTPAAQSFTVILQPDPTLYEGSFAGNAWLQECPKPLTKQVWGNALSLSAADAARFGFGDGDAVALAVRGQEIVVPVHIQTGHASGVGSLALGNGRSNAGPIGDGVGGNAYILRTAAAGWRLNDVSLRTTKGPAALAIQKEFTLDGDREEIFPSYAVGEIPTKAREDAPKPNLLPAHDYTQAAARWAMVIDNTSCIGCNACVVACQVENNVPVIGPDEIARNRDMHWLRIDAYALEGADGRLGFEPVPCMHCETAPCEPVCPVGASIHDSEGLNVQVYNRCIGTRFCQANCPYKVRRFNFFGYADDQAYGNLGEPVVAAHNNPNVTVRARGVMEKCTYCVQRISGARRAAEKENRPLRAGDVTTACQNACPTQAIVFGNLNDPESDVARLRGEPQHFTLLGKLNTLPRTTYLADIRNPHPNLSGVKQPEPRG